MRRYAELYLEEWIQQKDRLPLIIRGARQVGKSTLVRNFARQKKLDLIEINFEKTPIKSFNAEQFSIENVLLEIEVKTDRNIKSNTLIFFDEIQSQPKALERLRYFYEERPDLKIICAGSLLDLYLEEFEISFPVGRVCFFNLGPMSFCEFLEASGKIKLSEMILADKTQDFSHEILLEELKKYFFIGGMPKAVKTYIEERSILKCRQIHRALVQTYIADFLKYRKKLDVEKLERVFYSAINSLGKKVIYQHLDVDSKSVEIKRLLQLLIKSRLFTPCYHTDCSNIPIKAQKDPGIFKLYFLDIGLINYVHDFKWEDLNQLFDSSFATKGILAEQFVAQHLAYFENGMEEPQLLYWLRDKSTQKAEIDFVLQMQGQIIPIEVKAEAGGRLKSLIQFAKDKKQFKGFKLSKKYFNEESIPITLENKLSVIGIPIYAVESLNQIINKNLKKTKRI